MQREKKQKLPIGIESFEEIRENGFYYVDKTGMILDLLDNWGKVNLFTRPRRFGKSLNMSMLQSFFEIGCHKALFDGLEVAKDEELCDKYMGQFPVISISLKSVNGDSYDQASALIRTLIGDEALRFESVLLQSDKLTDGEKERYRQLIAVDAEGIGSYRMGDAVLMGSLKLLSALLMKHYGQKVIILIDEYDVPLAKANDKGYYEPMVTLLRGLFEQALKTNDFLYFAVLTGCLRVAKESIFTGLDNPKILSITSAQFHEYFGFTDGEVREMLKYYEVEDKYEMVREWYDGYHFGNTDVYCPWDVINYCDELRADPAAEPREYWSNTSGNDVVRHFVEHVDKGLAKDDIETLVAGESVVKEIHEELTYNQLYDTIDNIWSVLFMTGYLTSRERVRGKYYRLAIPNMEIRNIFTEQIMALFKEETARDGETLNIFCEALRTGNAPEVERVFTMYLQNTVSIRDTFVRKPTKENFYHGILLGILGFKYGWSVKSNKESGEGYSDIMVKTGAEGIGMLIEVKYAENRDYETMCRDALEQIEEEGYATELKLSGCHIIYKYGIACCRKECRVAVKKEILYVTTPKE